MVDRVYQRNTSDSAPQPPTDPSIGYPTGGNPAQGVPATIPGPYWYHMITESLRRVVVEAGLTPDHQELDQVVSALTRLTARNVTTITASGSPKALTVADAGLVLIDATSGAVSITLPSAVSNPGVSYRIVRTDTANANAVTITPDDTDTIEAEENLSIVVGDSRNIESDGEADWKRSEPVASETLQGMLKVATQALVDAGDDDATVVTPKKMRWGVSFSAGSDGYLALPSWMGGFIFQWLNQAGSAGERTSQFPIPFPEAHYRSALMQASTSGTSAGTALYRNATQEAITMYYSTNYTGLIISIGR
ncbi:gp53-like domain-containing protein [Halomonas sp. CSM-2]|uniref:gp53-like domain-containing protein n=1 Tax=Halomonas sp. CSM-2 TaxID=1975722 RepID=UPI000A28B61F|nr:hypothetical protein [Halomonas sp. CSM-2]